MRDGLGSHPVVAWPISIPYARSCTPDCACSSGFGGGLASSGSSISEPKRDAMQFPSSLESQLSSDPWSVLSSCDWGWGASISQQGSVGCLFPLQAPSLRAAANVRYTTHTPAAAAEAAHSCVPYRIPGAWKKLVGLPCRETRRQRPANCKPPCWPQHPKWLAGGQSGWQCSQAPASASV